MMLHHRWTLKWYSQSLEELMQACGTFNSCSTASGPSSTSLLVSMESDSFNWGASFFFLLVDPPALQPQKEAKPHDFWW